MAQPLPLPPPGFDDLSAEEKIDYVNHLWDRIAAKPEEIPVPEWHRRLLDERIAQHEAHPEEALPWEEVERDLRQMLRDRRAAGAR